MNLTEYMLTKLSEESAEVAQRAAKAQCFGLHEVEPGQGYTNTWRLVDEIVDFLGAVSLCEDLGILTMPNSEGLARLIEKKKLKIRQYMEYSRKCGTLQDPP